MSFSEQRKFPAGRSSAFAFEYRDFKLEGYTAHPGIKAPIAV